MLVFELLKHFRTFEVFLVFCDILHLLVLRVIFFLALLKSVFDLLQEVSAGPDLRFLIGFIDCI